MTKKIPAALPWVIWFLSALFYFYENMVQVSPSVMVHDLMSSFSVSAVALGNLSAVYLYAYASMQLPVGILVDRFSVRSMLTLATVACVSGCFLFGLTNSLFYASFGQFLMGFGSAFAAVCTMKLAANWFPSSKFPLLVGLMVTIGMTGSIVGEKPLALLVEIVGWRHSMVIIGIAGTVLALLICLVVRNGPHNEAPKTASKEQSPRLLSGLKQVVLTTQSWSLAIYGGLMFASTSIFGGLWGVPYIMQAYGVDKPSAAGIVSLLFLGWVIGSPLTGWVASTLKSRKKVMLIGSAGALTTMLLILYLPMSMLLLDVVMFLFGVFSSCFLPSFSLIKELHDIKYSGAALGFMNMANMLGGALGKPLVGFLLDTFWSGQLINTTKIYSTTDYRIALTVLPLMIAVSLILLLFIDENAPKN